MGSFYTNITLKGPTQREVVAAVSRMQRSGFVSPTYVDLTVVFDVDSEQQDGSGYQFAEELSKQLGCLALYVSNHDDSVLYYRLFDTGRVLDDYDSSPNYFDGPPIGPEGGNAAVLCQAFDSMPAMHHVEEILRYSTVTNDEGDEDSRYVFEIDRHRDLAVALGLPTIAVGFGATYLAEGEWPDGLSVSDCVAVTAGSEE